MNTKNGSKGTAAKTVSTTVVKPTAAGTTAVKGAATPPAPVVDAGTAPKATKAKLPLTTKAKLHLARQAARINRLAATFDRWGGDAKEAGDALREAHGWVHAAITAIGKLPADFKPAKGAGAGTSSAADRFEVGGKVEIAEKARPDFEGAMEALHMLDLTVTGVSGKQVRCVAPDGCRFVIHSTKLRAQGHGAAQAAKRAAREDRKAQEAAAAK